MTQTITIGGREFRVGAWYRSKRHKGAYPRQFLDRRDDARRGVYVVYRWPEESTATDPEQWCSARSWRAWDGDEVAP